MQSYLVTYCKLSRGNLWQVCVFCRDRSSTSAVLQLGTANYPQWLICVHVIISIKVIHPHPLPPPPKKKKESNIQFLSANAFKAKVRAKWARLISRCETVRVWPQLHQARIFQQLEEPRDRRKLSSISLRSSSSSFDLNNFFYWFVFAMVRVLYTDENYNLFLLWK